MNNPYIPPYGINSTPYDINSTYTISVTDNTAGYNFNNLTFDPVVTSSDNTLHVKGKANIEGELVVQGVDILETLEKIEDKLAILRPNIELEEKWEELRKIRKQYMALEAEIKEKESIWATLKK